MIESAILLKIGLWLLNCMCLAGQILITRYNKVGIILWIIADTLWAIYDFKIHQIEQAVLWSIYTLISIWQLYMWRKNGK